MPWREVEPLPALNGTVEPIRSTVDSLHKAWERSIAQAPTAEFAQARQRSLRRHAIETGIIERLYDLDWGVTEALVAEGITAEVAARQGGVPGDALDLMRDQLDALEFLVGAVREGRDLSVFFIRELHQLITAHQPVYDARDALGRAVQVPLPRGEWKTQPNHVRRPDGSLLEYTPPEHVPAQMERLVELYRQTEGAHPVVRATWLHHRFIRIHPFADGNGRVARALTLLALLRGRYAPLVVDRRNRPDYIAALDAANDGDLRPLVHLFAQLQIVAMRAELERPALVAPVQSGAVAVVRAHVERLRGQRAEVEPGAAARTTAAMSELVTRFHRMLQPVIEDIERAFRELDPDARTGMEDVRGANVDLVSVFVRVLGYTFRYSVAVGDLRASGVLVLEADAYMLRPAPDHEQSVRLLDDLPPTDMVLIAPDETVAERWDDAAELVDRTLTAAVGRFSQQLY
ncbi:hypothetical protein Cs7R123_70860 [Catellatospora sp. TT07R-123]|uniref:Fic family protein n=1 Tax=Catellatospora sp. TT07R-123 TaxID=2733863 RepID=UPI001B2B4263|nr:Fic family protein [Catellatospora sp. TT07R-123]GHJ49744.1 hypothetical protein Cs7R123_70860 [Catellatospora sp. TT07R-123]